MDSSGDHRHTTVTASKMVKVIVGMMGSSVAKGSASMATVQQVASFLAAVKSYGVQELDTARVYNGGKSEELLGNSDAQKKFEIATKAPAFAPGSLAEAKILENAKKSFAALQQEKVDIYYLHGPDRTTPLEEQCRAIGKLYQQGKFKRFGVSNISADEVQQIYNICRDEGYCLPQVYQGGYNPLSRSAEAGLFPTLKRLGMSFYAFSPLAGGLLAKPIDQILKPKPGSRYDEMPVFGNIYCTEPVLTALKAQTELGEKHGITIMESTLRWFKHHSPLSAEDGLILGASSTSQIEASLKACEQPPLPQEVADGWEKLWQSLDDGSMNYYVK